MRFGLLFGAIAVGILRRISIVITSIIRIVNVQVPVTRKMLMAVTFRFVISMSIVLLMVSVTVIIMLSI